MVETSETSFPNIGKDRLFALIEAYPWCAAARARLCMDLFRESGAEAADGLFRDSLPYFPDGAFIAARMRRSEDRSYTDADLAEEIKNAIRQKRRIVMAGGDYFSLSDYDSVRHEEDADIRKMAIVDYSAPEPAGGTKRDDLFDLVSETLARIYAEQGYPDKAKEVYLKLSLLNPEKSAYFATIIEKLGLDK